METHQDHEQISTDLPRVGPRTVTLFSVGVIAVFAILFVTGYIPHRARIKEANKVAEEQTARPIVEVAQPRKPSANPEIILPGDARALQETWIYPRANGYLKKFYFDIGDHVKANQLLAEIDTPEVDAQLNESKAAHEQASANFAKVKTDFELATATFTRYESLSKTGAVTAQDLDEKRSQFNQAKSALAAAQANVAAAQAAVQRLTEMQSFEKVSAPFPGVITARNYDVGALLNPANSGPGKELFRLARVDTLRVFVNVPQPYVDAIKINQPATFESRSSSGKRFTGKVTRAAGAIDPSTRTMRFQVDFPNPEDELHAGMFGNVRLALSVEHPPLILPTSAMLFRSDGTSVAVIEDNKVRLQKVTVGRDFGTEMEVTDGLTGNEQIVTNPGARLVDGVEVQIAKSATPPANSTAAR